MKSQRQLQIGETIKRVISEIFVRDDILTVPGSYITILEASVSPDAKNVRIYIDIFGNEPVHEKIVKKLNEMAPHFRYKMAQKINLRTVPEITFVLDKTERKAIDLETVIADEASKYEAFLAQKKTPRRTSRPSPKKKK